MYFSILGIDTGINEMSSMAGGSVQGAAVGAKGGPWNTKDVKKYNKQEKETSKLVGRSLAVEEKMDLNIIDDVIKLIMERGIVR